MLRRKGRKTIPSQLMRETVPETELDDSNNLKGKLKFAQSFNQGVSFKTDESLATPYFRNMACERNDTQVLNKKINQTIAEEELPDGSCFSRVVKLKTSAPAGPSSASLHPCEYVGSFLVAGSDQASRAEFVRIQLENLRGTRRRKSVVLVVSLSGVKVCSLDGKSVHMAHALRRISYVTCDPQHQQFSFLAREPNGHFTLQYCHSFVTDTAEQAEKLSTSVGSAFRMAFARQLQHQPTFHEIIRKQLESGQPAVTPADRGCWRRQEVTETDVTRQSNRLNWAKKVVGVYRHHDPMVKNVLELTGEFTSPCSAEVANESMNDHFPETTLTQWTSTVENRNSSLSLPVTTDAPPDGLEPWSPPSSSSENNSPTSLNRQPEEKSPLVKTVDIKSSPNSEDAIKKTESHQRPLSGGYINDGTTWDSNNLATEENKETSATLHKETEKSADTSATSGDDCLVDESSDFSSKRSSHSSCDHSAPSLSGSVTSVDERVESGTSSRSQHTSQTGSTGSDRSQRTSQTGSTGSDRSQRTSQTGSTGSDRSQRTSQTGSTASRTPPPPPERHDSLLPKLSEERELRGAPWFQAGIPREIALEILSQEPVGTFMVRESTSKPGCYALSLRVPREFQLSGIAHYLIMRTHRGYKIKGFTKEFNTLTSLITHHSVMPELLPCPLSLSRYNPTFRKQDSSEDLVDVDEDPDYNLLSDFRKMMADLNV
ncbi:uncharacterized protein LOC143254084 isoform X2 [Tachypleus tridentatus]|uniref:uncharacterized protein LOC143254084 isoform X2 n=1 Tax=Tachypleus tridentatus TaxID=6853 RepID=UPI003FCF8FB4